MQASGHPEKPNGAQQAADAKSPDGDAEFIGVALKSIFYEYRTKNDQRPAQRARQKHREQRATQVRLRGNFSYAGEGMVSVEFFVSRLNGASARQNPQRDPDEWQI
jgi:hypothetical protein